MKQRGLTQKTEQKYVGFLIELKKAIEVNPFMTTSSLVKKHKVGFDLVTILKTTGTLKWINKTGWLWAGSYPNAEMVYKIHLWRKNENRDRKAKQNNPFELYTRKKRNLMSQGEINPLKWTPDAKIKLSESVDEWKARLQEEIKHQSLNLSNIEIIKPTPKPQQVLKENKSWELKIFGFTIIKINK